VPRLIINAASLFAGDPHLTLARFLSHHRVPYRQSAGMTEARMPGGGTARAMFDDEGRFINWEAGLTVG
jgi:hypothetical protein